MTVRAQAVLDWRTEKARQMRALNESLGWRPVESPPIPTPVIAQAAFAGYPQPPNGSKRGMHWSASCYPEEHGWRDNLALCRDMGMGYIKFVDDGGASGLNVYRACWHEYGMVPVIRFYIGMPGQCGQRESDAIKRIADALGFATYFELCNEPDLPIEWNYNQPKTWLYDACWAFCDYAPKVLAAGGLPGTFALASGAFGQVRIDQQGNVIEPVKVNFLKLIVDRIGKGVFESGAWVSMHNYPINHPVDYPYDEVNQAGRLLTVEEYNAAPPWAWDNRPMADINAQRARDANPGDNIYDDDTCVRAYIPFQDQLRECGFVDPETGEITVGVGTTEGSYTMTRGDDGRYPKVHEQLQADGTERIYREIGPIVNYLFHADWLLYNTTGGWATDCRVGGSHDYSRTIHLLKTTPIGAWGEKFGAAPIPDPDPDPDPEPEPEPTPDPEPLPPVAWNLPDWNEAQLVAVDSEPGEWYWRLIRAELTPDNMANTVWVDLGDAAPEVRAFVLNANGVVEELPYKEPPELRNRPIWRNDRLEVWIDDGQHRSDRVRDIHTAYWDIPNVNTYHLGYLLRFRLVQEPAEPEPEPEPDPEPDPEPGEITDEDIRRAAWDYWDVPYNPDAAFPVYAREHGLGVPLTHEFDLNDTIRAQGYAGGIVYATIGDWANIHELEW
jgi:hypothetical protein